MTVYCPRCGRAAEESPGLARFLDKSRCRACWPEIIEAHRKIGRGATFGGATARRRCWPSGRRSVDELRCPWCGGVVAIWCEGEPDCEEWRWTCHDANNGAGCGASGPARPTHDEAVESMAMVTGPCPICHEQGAPDRPMVVCQCCHEFVNGEREDAIARADAAEADAVSLREDLSETERLLTLSQGAAVEEREASRAAEAKLAAMKRELDAAVEHVGDLCRLRSIWEAERDKAVTDLAVERALLSDERKAHEEQDRQHREDLTALMWHIHQDEKKHKMTVDEALRMYRQYRGWKA